MHYPNSLWLLRLCVVTGSSLALSLAGYSQSAPEPAKADSGEVVETLSPFEISASSNMGYLATSSMAGTRLNTDLRDIASAISVVTPEFLADTGATSVEDILIYTPNTEVGGLEGNFFGTNAGDTTFINRLLTEPHKSTRVRGLNDADLTRNFFLTDIGLDSYNVAQVDIQRGPNSVLFGLGSPAGIINYSFKNPNMVQNKYGAEVRVGSHNMHRESIDLDQTIIKDVFGVRIMAVNEHREFEQNFKYEDAKRATVAGRWTPKLRESIYTQFQVNYEGGDTDSNRPRVVPPSDFITNWFDPNRANFYTSPTGVGNSTGGGALDRYMTGGPANNWWDSLGLVYQDPTTSTAGIPGVATAIRQRGGNPWGGWISPKNPNWDIYGAHEAAQKSYYANNPEIMAIIDDYEKTTGKTFNGFGGWPDQLILDDSLFNYREETLEGPNSTQMSQFDTLDLSFVQTYFHGKVGVEVVYNTQEYETGYENLVGGSSVITVDVNQRLRDGRPNPNLGRPFFVDATDGQKVNRSRENFRATAFYKFDFADIFRDRPKLTGVLGSHIFTVVAAEQKWAQDGRSYNLYRYDETYRRLDNDDRVFGVHYIGPDLRGKSLAQGLHLQGLQTTRTPPTSLNAMVQGRADLGITDWSIVPVGILDQSSGLNELYTGAWASKDKTETKSFTWQSRFFNDHVIGLFGWRDDSYEKVDKPQNPPTNSWGKPQPDDPSWSFEAGANAGRVVAVEDENTSWGVMVHSPDFINRYLPLDTRISLGYNEASNFRPSDVSQDIYGRQNPAPAGESKDYTVIVSMLKDRLSFRGTVYETFQKNTRFRGTAPSGYDIAGVLARTMNGLMTETYLDGNTYDTAGNIIAVGRQNTTPERFVNEWMFGQGKYDTAVANTPLPAGWTVQNHPELLTQPLRVRASAFVVKEGDINPATGVAYTQPPITPEEANYRRAWFAAQPDSNWYQPYGEELFNGLGFKRDPARKWGFWPDSAPSGLAQTADIKSTGVELELTANVTSNWRLIMNVTESEAVSSNIMPVLGEYIEANRDWWHYGYTSNAPAANYWQRDGFADIDYWGNNNSQRFQDWTTGMERKYLIGAASEGRPVAELRKWHWNLVTTYDFREGRLRNFSLGGSVRWQDESIVGYFPEYLQDIDVWISDLDKPILAPAETNYDMWMTYKRRLNDKVDWRIQVNVRNLFAEDTLITTQANPDGSVGQARIPAYTTWELTNAFSF